MNYNQMQWMQMQQMQGMPFYMTYPVRNIYMTEMEYERDRERMNQLYPKEAKELQKYVEEECDKLEYEGSMMFDEYPDRMMLRMICDRIYQEYTNQNQPNDSEKIWNESMDERMEISTENQADAVEGMQLGRPGCNDCPPDRPPERPPMRSGRPPMRPGRPPQNNQGLNNLIEVLLYNEMYKRRCRHKRCRQWW